MTTRKQQENTSAEKSESGQRHITKVWEYSQAAIALAVTIGILYTSIMGIHSEELANGFFLIVGFYFSRVNPQGILPGTNGHAK